MIFKFAFSVEIQVDQTLNNSQFEYFYQLLCTKSAHWRQTAGIRCSKDARQCYPSRNHHSEDNNNKRYQSQRIISSLAIYQVDSFSYPLFEQPRDGYSKCFLHSANYLRTQLSSRLIYRLLLVGDDVMQTSRNSSEKASHDDPILLEFRFIRRFIRFIQLHPAMM